MLAILWLCHIGIIVYELSKKSLGVLLWAVLLAVFTIPHTVHSFMGNYSDETLNAASIIAVLFTIMYFLIRCIYFYFQKSTVTFFDIEKLKTEDQHLVNIYFMAYVFSFLIIMGGIYARAGSIFNITWSDHVYGSVSFIENIANLVLMTVAGLGFILFFRKEKRKFIVVVVIFILYLVVTKSRYNILGFTTPFMIFLLFHKNKKLLYWGVASGFAVLIGVFMMQQMRYMGSFSKALSVGFIGLFQRSVSFMKEGKGEFELIKSFYYFISKNNQFKDFGQGLGYIRLVMLLLPTSLVPFKPRDFAKDIYREWYRYDDPRGTMHPTLFGDVYANFGFLGFFMGAFYGVLVSAVDELMIHSKSETMKILRMSLICTMLILLGRGAVYNSIANCIFGLFILAFIQYSAKFLRRWA